MRVAAVVLCAAMAAGTLGGCGGGGGAAGKKGADGGGPSSSTSAGSAGSSTSALGRSGTDKNGVPTTVKAGSKGPGASKGSTTPTTGRQRRPGVPAPGRYLYSTGTSDSAVKALDVYEDAGQSGDDVVQLETWTQKSSIERGVVTWRKDAKIVDREQRATPDERGQPQAGPLCDWEPDVLDTRMTTEVGVSWTAKATCAQGDGVTKDRTLTAKVTSTDTVVVEGEQVPVVVIERTVVDVTHLKIGPLESRTTSTDWFSPGLALLVRSTGTVEQKVAASNSNNAFRMDIKSVHPSPPPG
ncbi:MAG: hypothetical protein QOI20_2512 [Acidimicrobiaceae bacterium]|nr:hypothetical protein [Acidimicrobiaceae bacterium]